MNDTQKQLLFKNTVAEVGGAERLFRKGDPIAGKADPIADALGIAIEDVPEQID